MESYNNNQEFLEELFSEDWKTQKSLQMLAEDEQECLRLAMHAMLNLEQGRDILFYLVTRTRVFGPTFTGNSQSYWLEGRRSIGLELYHLILLVDPDGGMQRVINHGRKSHALKHLKE